MNSPENVRIIPEFNIAALNQGKDKELLFWYLLRSINETGSGHIDLSQAESLFIDVFNYSKPTFYRHLSRGEGKLWNTYHNKVRRIEIYGLKRVFRYLNTFNVSRFLNVDIETVRKYPRKALLWNTGAYRPFGTGRNNAPVSREALHAVTGIYRRKQQRYDTSAETSKTATMAKAYDQDTHKVFMQRMIVDGKSKKYIIPRQLGNIYQSHAYQSQKGMLKKLSRTERQRQGSLLAGEAPNKKAIPARRFYGTFQDWLKQYIKGKAEPGDVFYKSRSDYSIYIEVKAI